MNITNGDQETIEDQWTSGTANPGHRQQWTGETWFEEKKDQPTQPDLKRDPDPLVPRSRFKSGCIG